MTFTFRPGWEYDDSKIARAVESMAAAGCQVALSNARPNLKGFWKGQVERGVTGVYAQDYEEKLLGHWRDTNVQVRGTCTRQAMRCLEDTYNAKVQAGLVVGEYAELSCEPAYGYMRHLRWGATHPWGCRCGRCPDGLMGADIAEFVATKGVLKRGVYGDVDLTKSREDLEITWNNTGVPKHIIESCAPHKMIAHKCANFDEVADCIASLSFASICLPEIFSGSIQDRYGYCEPDGVGGHATAVVGVAISKNNETIFIIQQSWPLGAVHYRTEIPTAGGNKRLRPGSYAVRKSVLESIMASHRDRVELWAFDVPGASRF